MHLLAMLLIPASIAMAGTDSYAHLGDVQCRDQAVKMLTVLAPRPRWFNGAPTSLGAQVKRSPTSMIGRWVETDVYPDHHVEVLLRTLEKIDLFTWDSPGCEVKHAVQSVKNDVPDNAFTDRDLIKLMKEHPVGIVYVWSPNMPLSEESLHDVTNAVADLKKEGLNVHITYVLDPNADRKVAARLVVRDHLGHGVLSPMWSLEMLMRGMTLHYPSMLVYSKGKIVSEVPGAKSPNAYARIIKEVVQ